MHHHEPLVGPKDPKEVEKVDDCIVLLKGNQRYQKIFGFLLIIVFISGNRFLTMYPFLQLYPGLQCLNQDGTYSSCTQEVACSEQNINSFKVEPDSYITLNNWMVNLNLICQPKYEIGLQGTLLFIGQAIGAIFLTHWADVFGRKKTMIFHGGMYAVFVMIATLNQTLLQTYINIFFIGLLFVPRSACIFTYIMEIAPDSAHDNMMFAVYMGDGITFVISGIYTEYTRNVYGWLLILGISTLLCVFLLTVFLPESPRFLFSTKQYDKLKECFMLMNSMNNADYKEADIDEMMYRLTHHKESCKVNYKQSFFHDMRILGQSDEHFRSLIAVLGLWIYSAFNYYLIGYYVKYFPGNVFFNFMMMTVAEVLAPIYLRLVQGKYITKKVAQYLVVGAVISSSLYIINTHFGTVMFVPYIILLIRIFIKCLYSLGYYANGRLFPILVKTSIFSLTNGIGRPFSALATMVNEYTKSPGEIILFTSIALYFVTFFFPNDDDSEQEIERILAQVNLSKSMKLFNSGSPRKLQREADEVYYALQDGEKTEDSSSFKVNNCKQ